MTTKHQTVSWIAGDDWQVNATLLDENGVPFDLTTADIKWCLLNDAGLHLLSEDDVLITIVDASAGKCSIQVPAAKTSPLHGQCTDYVRIIKDTITSTLSYGVINVTRDPWAAAVAPAMRVVLSQAA